MDGQEKKKKKKKKLCLECGRLKEVTTGGLRAETMVTQQNIVKLSIMLFNAPLTVCKP